MSGDCDFDDGCCESCERPIEDCVCTDIFASRRTVVSDKSESALLPCPFCGGSAEEEPGIVTYIGCPKCNFNFSSTDDWWAVECWNKRAPDAAQAERIAQQDRKIEDQRQAMISGNRLTEKLQSELAAARECVGLFASAIKSGERWTRHCQKVYDAYLAARWPESVAARTQDAGKGKA